MRILILFSVLSSISSQASPIVIPDHRCLNTTVDRVVEAVINYSNYVHIEDTTLSIGGLQAAKMDQSFESPRVKGEEGKSNDSFVHITIRPGFLKDYTLFPRFWLRCQVNQRTASFAHHECHIVRNDDFADYKVMPPDPAPYGLAGFSSDLKIDANDPGCRGGTEITYQLTMDTNPDQVKAIMSKLTLGMSDRLDGPDSRVKKEEEQNHFFRAFYEKFYLGWVKTIK